MISHAALNKHRDIFGGRYVILYETIYSRINQAKFAEDNL